MSRSKLLWSIGIALNVYSITSVGQSTFVTGMDTRAPASMSKPALNVPYVDSNYKTTVTRVSDASQITDVNIPSFVRHEYSRRPAFNSDSSRALMISSNGWLRLYSVDKTSNKLSFLKTLTIGGSVEPNWHPTNPNIIRFLGINGQSLQISEYDITNDQKTVVRNLSSRIKALYPSAAGMWTKDEGRPSNDGKIWCFQVESGSFGILGLISYNFETDQILGNLNITDGQRPDHISTSPKGNYCVPSWDTARGTRAYSLDFASYTQLHSKSEHSDLALTKDGKEVYVFSDYNSGDVAMVDMASGARTNLFRLYGSNSSSTAMHISGVGSEKNPGHVVIGFYGCSESYGSTSCNYNTQWFKDKIIISELKANPTIYNLAHTHFGNAGYWGETQAVSNKDMSKILFVSSWESTVERDVASYMINVPVANLGVITTPEPEVPAPQPTEPPTQPPVVTPPTNPTQGLVLSNLVVKRTGAYVASVNLKSNSAADCRIATSSGHSYGALYDNLTSASNKLSHSKSVGLGSRAGVTRYVVCKKVSGSEQKELKVVIPAY